GDLADWSARGRSEIDLQLTFFRDAGEKREAPAVGRPGGTRLAVILSVRRRRHAPRRSSRGGSGPDHRRTAQRGTGVLEPLDPRDPISVGGYDRRRVVLDLPLRLEDGGDGGVGLGVADGRDDERCR